MIQGLPAPRLMLHASALTFPHPDGGRITLRAPLPADFAALLAGLGLHAPDLEGPPVTREARP